MTCKSPTTRWQRGFTLLELMLATVILATALIALSLAVSRCIRGFSAVKNLQIALNIVETKLVDWRLENVKLDEVKTGLEEGDVTVGGRSYHWRNEVQSTDDPKILKYEFTIRWNEGGSAIDRSFIGFVPRSTKNA